MQNKQNKQNKRGKKERKALQKLDKRVSSPPQSLSVTVLFSFILLSSSLFLSFFFILTLFYFVKQKYKSWMDVVNNKLRQQLQWLLVKWNIAKHFFWIKERKKGRQRTENVLRCEREHKRKWTKKSCKRPSFVYTWIIEAEK